ncbi:hypothetical protein [Streptomyces noursei]|uniref:hypothetical protein n=1 Tax=Streptomyces noursei TaxID=1971 RepID=UPI0030F2A087
MTTEFDKLGVWQLLFDTTYAPGGAAVASEATVGWNSSFTGEPFTAEEMTEWVERTVERIRALAPPQTPRTGLRGRAPRATAP